jgi:cellobiose phosphorylase
LDQCFSECKFWDNYFRKWSVIRDEENGKFWSPTPLPVRGRSPYITKHGFGYSIFQHSEDGIYSEMTVFVDIEASIKFIILKLHNQSNRSRKLSATGYMEWVMGFR